MQVGYLIFIWGFSIDNLLKCWSYVQLFEFRKMVIIYLIWWCKLINLFVYSKFSYYYQFEIMADFPTLVIVNNQLFMGITQKSIQRSTKILNDNYYILQKVIIYFRNIIPRKKLKIVLWRRTREVYIQHWLSTS